MPVRKTSRLKSSGRRLRVAREFVGVVEGYWSRREAGAVRFRGRGRGWATSTDAVVFKFPGKLAHFLFESSFTLSKVGNSLSHGPVPLLFSTEGLWTPTASTHKSVWTTTKGVSLGHSATAGPPLLLRHFFIYGLLHVSRETSLWIPYSWANERDGEWGGRVCWVPWSRLSAGGLVRDRFQPCPPFRRAAADPCPTARSRREGPARRPSWTRPLPLSPPMNGSRPPPAAAPAATARDPLPLPPRGPATRRAAIDDPTTGGREGRAQRPT